MPQLLVKMNTEIAPKARPMRGTGLTSRPPERCIADPHSEPTRRGEEPDEHRARFRVASCDHVERDPATTIEDPDDDFREQWDLERGARLHKARRVCEALRPCAEASYSVADSRRLWSEDVTLRLGVLLTRSCRDPALAVGSTSVNCQPHERQRESSGEGRRLHERTAHEIGHRVDQDRFTLSEEAERTLPSATAKSALHTDELSVFAR